MTDDYSDIIDLPCHISPVRPRMPMSDRAAQFSPFAALNGYDSAIKETARLTEEKAETADDQKEIIDMKLRRLLESSEEQPAVSVTYFVRDSKKSGGKYIRVSGSMKRIDTVSRRLILTNGDEIPIDDISDIE